MAIAFTDFSKIAPQDNGVGDIFGNVLKGYQIEEEPKKMAEEAKAKKLANALQEAALKHKPKEYELSDALKVAQINKANRTPAAGGKGALKPNAAVANAEYIWQLNHPNGDTTPEEKAAHTKLLQDAFDTGLEHTAEGTKRTKVLNDTQEDRAPRSSVEKVHYELSKINRGERPYSPTHEKLSPEEETKSRNDLLLDIVKKTTDQQTRAKLQNGLNMNITLAEVQPKKLVQYSGIMNKGQKLADFAEEHFGKGSEQFRDYQREVNKAQFAAKQMRQYLGDSIQPTAQQRLDHLTNPEAWNVTPRVAEENFEFMRDLMKRETNTLIRAATDPTIYQASGQQAVAPSSGVKVYNPATGRLE
jgi:hypothetical protein